MGVIFDKYKVLHVLPKVGQKIKFIKPTMSWFTNVNEDVKKLVPDQEYTVRKTELNSSSTYVWLEEFPNIFDPNDPNDGRDQPFFSMASFEWETPELDLNELIGLNPVDVCRLSHTYKCGIELDGEIWCGGERMLVVEYETIAYDNRKSDIVTKVYYK
jgi:hypothetical protein